MWGTWPKYGIHSIHIKSTHWLIYCNFTLSLSLSREREKATNENSQSHFFLLSCVFSFMFAHRECAREKGKKGSAVKWKRRKRDEILCTRNYMKLDFCRPTNQQKISKRHSLAVSFLQFSTFCSALMFIWNPETSDDIHITIYAINIPTAFCYSFYSFCERCEATSVTFATSSSTILFFFFLFLCVQNFYIKMRCLIFWYPRMCHIQTSNRQTGFTEIIQYCTCVCVCWARDMYLPPLSRIEVLSKFSLNLVAVCDQEKEFAHQMKLKWTTRINIKKHHTHQQQWKPHNAKIA